MKKQCITLSLIFLLNNLVYSQSSPYLYLRNNPNLEKRITQKNNHLIEKKEGHIVNTLITRDGQIRSNDVDLTEVIDVIVEFKEEPLFIKKRKENYRTLEKSAYKAQTAQFSTDLSNIHRDVSDHLKITLAYPEIKREFYKIFNGVSLKVPLGTLPDIHKLEYVKRIHRNEKVEAYLNDSVSLIRADSVWSQFGTKGDSVVVGILDTGIDYTHPALGGGFGPGYKVIGGYDIVNNDDDPMDDNSHGTYVAGIVAANGDSVSGVAPNALLMAFKVLKENGWGSEDDVIGGIERAVDPNNDDDFNDQVDVANMSLGGPGNPDDAKSIAVDNAVSLGVVFCIAAGNDREFYSIGSPGTARSSITVGATDKSDEIAGFSSKGPNSKIYTIKPEVVAPGVDIISLNLNEKYREASGTSAAAPHVAGVCALLKSIHPDWSPAYIKSALMTTAIDIDEEVMVQGAGRIDAVNSANITTFAFPSRLDFGFDDVTQFTWTSLDTITIVNNSDSVQNFNISFNSFQPGINITADPAFFNVAAGDSQQVIFELTVENNMVPYPEEGSLAYGGHVFMNDQIHLPWAFLKASKVIVNFNELTVRFLAANDKNLISSPPGDRFELFEFIAPKGVYDIFTTNDDIDPWKVIIKENVYIEGVTIVDIDYNDALYDLNMTPQDYNGNLLTDIRPYYTFIFPDSCFLGSSTHSFSGVDVSAKISETSDRFSILLNAFHQNDLSYEGKVHVIHYPPIGGVHDHINVINDPNDFVMQNLIFKYPPNANYRDIAFTNTFRHIIDDDLWIQLDTWFMETKVNSNKWEGSIYSTKNLYKKIVFGTCGVANDTKDAEIDEPYIFTDCFSVVGDSIGSFSLLTPDLFLSPDGGTMTFGGSPIYTDAYHINNWDGESNIAVFPFFYGALNEKRRADMKRSGYTIYDDQNNIIISDSLINSERLDVNPGKYRSVVIDTNYFVEDVRGSAKLETRFDLNLSDANPPKITSLKLLNAVGVPVGKIEPNESVMLDFSASDWDFIEKEEYYEWIYQSIKSDSTHLYYKLYNSDDWKELEIVEILEDTSTYGIGCYYSADLSGIATFDSAGIDLKLEFQDMSGNSIQWTLEPAFAVGNFGINTMVESIDSEIPLTFALYPNYPNPFNPSTNICFDLPHTEKVSIKIYDILGREVRTLVNKTFKTGKYKLNWDGKNKYSQHAASGVYIYRIEAGKYKKSRKMVLIR